jgi:hypothetical protein
MRVLPAPNTIHKRKPSVGSRTNTTLQPHLRHLKKSECAMLGTTRHLFPSMASTATSFRSTCGSLRGAPEYRSQRFPAGTPQVGHFEGDQLRHSKFVGLRGDKNPRDSRFSQGDSNLQPNAVPLQNQLIFRSSGICNEG